MNLPRELRQPPAGGALSAAAVQPERRQVSQLRELREGQADARQPEAAELGQAREQRRLGAEDGRHPLQRQRPQLLHAGQPGAQRELHPRPRQLQRRQADEGRQRGAAGGEAAAPKRQRPQRRRQWGEQAQLRVAQPPPAVQPEGGEAAEGGEGCQPGPRRPRQPLPVEAGLRGCRGKQLEERGFEEAPVQQPSQQPVAEVLRQVQEGLALEAPVLLRGDRVQSQVLEGRWRHCVRRHAGKDRITCCTDAATYRPMPPAPCGPVKVSLISRAFSVASPAREAYLCSAATCQGTDESALLHRPQPSSPVLIRPR